MDLGCFTCSACRYLLLFTVIPTASLFVRSPPLSAAWICISVFTLQGENSHHSSVAPLRSAMQLCTPVIPAGNYPPHNDPGWESSTSYNDLWWDQSVTGVIKDGNQSLNVDPWYEFPRGLYFKSGLLNDPFTVRKQILCTQYYISWALYHIRDHSIPVFTCPDKQRS